MKIDQKYVARLGRKMWGYDGRIVENKRRVRDYRFYTKKEAEDAAATLVSKNVERDYEWTPRSQKTTLLAAWESFKQKYEAKGAGKDYRYRRNMDFIINMIRRTFVDELGAGFLVRDVKTKHLVEWAQRMEQDPSTLNAYARRLSGMLRNAQETFPDLVTYRVPKIAGYAPNPDLTRGRIVKPAEVALLVPALLNPAPRNPKTSVLAYRQRVAMYRDAADVFRIALVTGMRAKEMFRLAESQLSRHARRIEIDKTKTGYSRRIPLPEEVEAILDARSRDGLTDGEHFFPDFFTTQFYDSRIRRALFNACAEVGLVYRRDRKDEGFTLHDARATYITNILRGDAEKGIKPVSIGTAMRLSGHKSLQSFQKYVRLIEEEFDDAPRAALVMLPEVTGELPSSSQRVVEAKNTVRPDVAARREKFKSKYRGLTWVPVEGVWMVRIMDGTKRKFVGLFKDEEEGARAYDREARRIHGAAAVLNFPSSSGDIRHRSPVSKYHGVAWDAASGKWRARLTVNGKVHSLGRHAVEDDAARAYDMAVIRFGVESELNFPAENYQLRVVA
ncbi:MAG TPA: tyrosine-type recombinase/integrase [Pyrinomonadaceae bacterium]|nr:tyrosine-type recombinase/integrase [Pyrinomonadaceae bacterium]